MPTPSPDPRWRRDAGACASTVRPPRRSDARPSSARSPRAARLHRRWVQPAATPRRYSRVRCALRRAARAIRRTRRTRASSSAAHDDDALVGVFNLSEIVRGSFESALSRLLRLRAACRRRLHERRVWRSRSTSRSAQLKLHRVEANVQPGNARSIALVRGAGFAREGLLPALREDRRAAGATTSAGRCWPRTGARRSRSMR